VERHGRFQSRTPIPGPDRALLALDPSANRKSIGSPFNVTVGQDLFGTGSFNSRPAFAAVGATGSNIHRGDVAGNLQ